ncbi:MAG: GntR family transcriptional regulator [Chloroflexota bacterium]
MSVRQTKTSRPPQTAIGIEQLLEARIRKGGYAEGARIPTVRELAEQLRVNKNTVARAYQALERKGYLELTRGRGAFVRQREPTTGAVDSRWLARLDRLLDDAKGHAVSRDALSSEIAHSMDRVYGAPGLRAAFVECNAPDIEEMGGQLSAAAALELDGVMLSDFLARPAEFARRCDLIVTTFYHLSEVSKALGAESKDKVVGVHAMPAHDALLKVARLHAQVIGLVCDRSSTVDNLTHIIHTYHSSATIMPALIDDAPRLKLLLKKADAIVVTRSCHDQLMALQPKMPVIMVTFTIDPQSVEFLRARIGEQQSDT